MTGTVDSTCTSTPEWSHSSIRFSGSQQLLSTVRKWVPSSPIMRALHASTGSRRRNPP